jgi:hypothetical protein
MILRRVLRMKSENRRSGARSPDGIWRSGGGISPSGSRLSRAGARADIFGTCRSRAGRATIDIPLFPPTIFFFREAEIPKRLFTRRSLDVGGNEGLSWGSSKFKAEIRRPTEGGGNARATERGRLVFESLSG